MSRIKDYLNQIIGETDQFDYYGEGHNEYTTDTQSNAEESQAEARNISTERCREDNGSAVSGAGDRRQDRDDRHRTRIGGAIF